MLQKTANMIAEGENQQVKAHSKRALGKQKCLEQASWISHSSDGNTT